MANRYAVQSGNWSDTATWDGGTLPGSGDVVRPNNNSITIDQDVEVNQLTNNAAAPAAAGGTFAVSSIPGGGRVVTADIAGGSLANILAISATSGTLTLNGQIGSDVNSPVIVEATGTCSIIVNGNVQGTGANNGRGINITGAVSLTVNGNVSGGPAANGTNGFGAHGIRIAAAATVTIHGNISARGNGSNQGGLAVEVAHNNAVVDIDGAVFPQPGVVQDAGVTAISAGAGQQVRIKGPIYTNSLGAFPLNVRRWFTPQGNNLEIRVMDDNARELALKVLPEGLPATGDVREGVVYGSDDQSIGTLTVPDPSTVAKDVSTDHTVGTAALTPQAVWDHPMAELNEPNSTGARLKNTATISSTGAQIAAAVNNTPE